MAFLLPKLQLGQRARRQQQELMSNVTVKFKNSKEKEITYIAVCEVQRGITKVSATTDQPVITPLNSLQSK